MNILRCVAVCNHGWWRGVQSSERCDLLFCVGLLFVAVRGLTGGALFQFAKKACSCAFSLARRRRPVVLAMDSTALKIYFVKGPMLSTAEAEAFTAAYEMPCLPEMVHGSSLARFTHKPTGKSICFNAFDALKEWRRTCYERQPPQVVHSAAWKKER